MGSVVATAPPHSHASTTTMDTACKESMSTGITFRKEASALLEAQTAVDDPRRHHHLTAATAPSLDKANAALDTTTIPTVMLKELGDPKRNLPTAVRARVCIHTTTPKEMATAILKTGFVVHPKL